MSEPGATPQQRAILERLAEPSWVTSRLTPGERVALKALLATPADGTPLVTREQLASIEWRDDDTCPSCRGWKSQGHDPDCWLARALTAAPAQLTPAHTAAAERMRTLFRDVPLSDVEKLPNPDYEAASPAPSLTTIEQLAQAQGVKPGDAIPPLGSDMSDEEFNSFLAHIYAQRAPAPQDLRAALKQAHELLQDMEAALDPEAHPDLSARVQAILLPCDEANECPTVAASPAPSPPAGDGSEWCNCCHTAKWCEHFGQCLAETQPLTRTPAAPCELCGGAGRLRVLDGRDGGHWEECDCRKAGAPTAQAVAPRSPPVEVGDWLRWDDKGREDGMNMGSTVIAPSQLMHQTALGCCAPEWVKSIERDNRVIWERQDPR